MRILALQLKRIGDLVLTTSALQALRTAWPEAHIALAVAPGCASLLGAIPAINTGVVLGKGRGFRPWQQVLTGPWDVCLDFTGTDRSALAVALSRAEERVTFEWVKKSKLRAVAFNRFVASSVRERHTVDHYLDLAAAVARTESAPLPALRVPESARAEAEKVLRAHGVTGPLAVLHPGTARPEKYWLAERWTEVAAHLRARHGLACVITGGSDADELAHVASILGSSSGLANLAGQIDLLTFAALLAQARLCVSCDTGAVHLAAAFQTPQLALFGPTNPFHWGPRHARALVLSAAQPDAPLTAFTPRMPGGPMERISTAAVIRAIESVLAPDSSSSSSS
jgi:ADP-heptose:LPS heptosyltransferase